MIVSLSAHFDRESIVLDEEYPLPPQGKLIVTVLEVPRAEDANAERRAWSTHREQSLARAHGTDEPEYSSADAIP